MSEFETSIGGPRGGGFPQTTWGLLSQVNDPANRPALEEMALRYWKPVYRYVRMTWGRSNEDAKDVTQAFLLWLLEGDALAKYEPDRGSFRKYLKLLLGRFVSHQAEAMQRLKRGGGGKHFRLDDDEKPLDVADPRSTTPEKAFDDAWLAAVVHQAVERVRARFAGTPREVQFRAYEAYELADEKPTYAEVAAKLGVKESDVRNYLFAARDAIRDELREELRQTTGGEGAFKDEWRELFGE